jgi:phosphatidylserine/phosphatidylglycerophosphate/cardiolipin synthase-like enzyme
MDRPARKPVATVVLVASTFVATASAGDLTPRELPSNAVQPPGASFERSITRAQKRLLVKDLARATVSQVVRQPVRSVRVGAHRLAERLGVRLAESVPVLPVPPAHQSPEAGGPCTPACLTPLFDSEPAYRALMDLIASARCRIDLMIFGWDDDQAGRPVAAALIERARAGVPVRLMVDRGGYVTGEDNARVPLGCPTFLDALKAEPNIRVIETPDACFRFDHRKVAVIDDRIVWTGGMILTRPALFRWHNFAFLAEGPIVPQYAALFAERWQELGGEPSATCPSSEETNRAVPNSAVRMVRTDVGHRSLKEAVYGAVDSARHHIYIENPYFSDQILVKKLAAARARGVEVRAVLTLRGDVKAMNRFSTITANHLLRAGARVYLYPAMTHVKAMSVDGTLAYIGTGNFDELSLRNNREVSLTVRGPELIRQIDEGLFLTDMAASQELHALLPLPRGWIFLEAMSLWF